MCGELPAGVCLPAAGAAAAQLSAGWGWVRLRAGGGQAARLPTTLPAPFGGLLCPQPRICCAGRAPLPALSLPGAAGPGSCAVPGQVWYRSCQLGAVRAMQAPSTAFLAAPPGLQPGREFCRLRAVWALGADTEPPVQRQQQRARRVGQRGDRQGLGTGAGVLLRGLWKGKEGAGRARLPPGSS